LRTFWFQILRLIAEVQLASNASTTISTMTQDQRQLQLGSSTTAKSTHMLMFATGQWQWVSLWMAEDEGFHTREMIDFN
jgi:hypothetical protein